MINLFKRIWYSEPVVLVGALVAGWSAIVAYDQADDAWAIPVWVYIVAVPLVAFLTRITRRNVTPTGNE
jgi:hypothetical protein